MEGGLFALEVGFDFDLEIALVRAVRRHRESHAHLLALVDRNEILKENFKNTFL